MFQVFVKSNNGLHAVALMHGEWGILGVNHWARGGFTMFDVENVGKAVQYAWTARGWASWNGDFEVVVHPARDE